MPAFERFDRRHYETASVRDGYREWSPTYEGTVPGDMDLALLDRIVTVEWSALTRAADLGCGTGRTAEWLRAQGDFPIDGVDLTPQMLSIARAKALHDRLLEADLRATGLESGAYDLVICCLVDEHLPELDPLYAEAARLLAPAGTFVVVGFHPYFIMASGAPTHFDSADGTSIAIETHIHLPSEHMESARAAGLTATEFLEALIDDRWMARKPSWEPFREWPISFAWVWSAA